MKTRAALVTFLVGMASVAPAAEPAGKPPASRTTLTFYHWMNSPSETAALDALLTLYKAKYPDAVVEPTYSAKSRDHLTLFTLVKTNVRSGRPTDAVLMRAGYSPQAFASAAMIDRVDDVWTKEGLDKVVPAVFQDLNKIDGGYYLVPLSIHRDNVIWYNKTLLTKHGIHPASLTTWDAFFEAARKLRAEGVAAPIQMGIDWATLHVFANVVLSQGTPLYEDWINGKIQKAGDPRMVSALEVFKRYVGYANADRTSIPWGVALQRVIQGEGAFCTMGDWSDGEFRQAGLVYGKDYGALVVPGTKGVYSVTLDAFARPAKIARQPQSDQWLRLVASREGQDAFNSRKGSIPARADADIAQYSPYQRSAIADFKSAKHTVPNYGAATPEAYYDHFEKVILTFAAQGEVDTADAALAHATADLKDSFTRVWTLK